MKKEEIIRTIDHTLLKQVATWEQIRDLCKEGMESGTASVCIPPSFVKQAAEFVEDKLPICTVIGFPNGYQTTAIKVMEAAQAVKNGAERNKGTFSGGKTGPFGGVSSGTAQRPGSPVRLRKGL